MAAASIVEKLEGTDYVHAHYYGTWWFILIWAALAFLSIAMTYFGVNFFLTGMHSYA